MKKIKAIERLLGHKELRTKVYLFMSSTSYGDDYDPYEGNLTYGNLNPICINNAYVRELTPESAFWKQYGKFQTGMKEIICTDRWREAFENCNKIEIDSIEYQSFKGAPGGKTLITQRPNRLIRVVVTRAG